MPYTQQIRQLEALQRVAERIRGAEVPLTEVVNRIETGRDPISGAILESPEPAGPSN